MQAGTKSHTGKKKASAERARAKKSIVEKCSASIIGAAKLTPE